MDDRSPGKGRPNLDDRIREILGDTPRKGDIETKIVGNHSRTTGILRELPTAISDIPDTPKRRSSEKNKEKLGRATFTTARDSLIWYRHASELVFNGECGHMRSLKEKV